MNLLVATPLRGAFGFLADPRAAGLLVLVLVGVAVRRRQWRLLVLFAVAVGLSNTLAAELIKPLVDRPRPCEVLPLDLVRPCGSGAAMPSAHAANTAAAAAVAASPALAVVAVGVGLSRVVVGQHWPSDVVVGWLLGALVGAGVRTVARRYPGWT